VVRRHKVRQSPEGSDSEVAAKYDFYHEKDYRGDWLENLMEDIESKAAGRVKICQNVEEIAAWIGANAVH